MLQVKYSFDHVYIFGPRVFAIWIYRLRVNRCVRLSTILYWSCKSYLRKEFPSFSPMVSTNSQDRFYCPRVLSSVKKTSSAPPQRPPHQSNKAGSGGGGGVHQSKVLSIEVKESWVYLRGEQNPWPIHPHPIPNGMSNVYTLTLV
jgi:hypothetical protein